MAGFEQILLEILLIFHFVSNLQEEVENDDVSGKKGGATDAHELASADEPEPVLKKITILHGFQRKFHDFRSKTVLKMEKSSLKFVSIDGEFGVYCFSSYQKLRPRYAQVQATEWEVKDSTLSLRAMTDSWGIMTC